MTDVSACSVVEDSDRREDDPVFLCFSSLQSRTLLQHDPKVFSDSERTTVHAALLPDCAWVNVSAYGGVYVQKEIVQEKQRTGDGELEFLTFPSVTSLGLEFVSLKL